MDNDTLRESIRAEKAMNEALKEEKLKKARSIATGTPVKPRAKIIARNI